MEQFQIVVFWSVYTMTRFLKRSDFNNLDRVFSTSFIFLSFHADQAFHKDAFSSLSKEIECFPGVVLSVPPGAFVQENVEKWPEILTRLLKERPQVEEGAKMEGLDKKEQQEEELSNHPERSAGRKKEKRPMEERR